MESSDGLRITGFALTMWTNAWRALDAVGIGDSLRAKSVQIQGYVSLSIAPIDSLVLYFVLYFIADLLIFVLVLKSVHGIPACLVQGNPLRKISSCKLALFVLIIVINFVISCVDSGFFFEFSFL